MQIKGKGLLKFLESKPFFHGFAECAKKNHVDVLPVSFLVFGHSLHEFMESIVGDGRGEPEGGDDPAQALCFGFGKQISAH